MTFVVVYLIRARELVAVPDSWVQDLNTAKLKNNGHNSNQDFMVFVSLEDGTAIIENEPDFNAPLASRLEATIDACFICRIKRFFGKQVLFVLYNYFHYFELISFSLDSRQPSRCCRILFTPTAIDTTSI